MSVEKQEWQQLCEAASQEHDPEQLMTLISDLMKALDEGEASDERSSEF
jgi:hypothetical protein